MGLHYQSLGGSKTAMGATESQPWLEAARNGQEWALELLHSTHYDSVSSLCRRLLGSGEDAEDAIQSTFIQAFRTISRFRGDCRIKTWLYRIAVNESISLLRKRKERSLALPETLASPDGAKNVLNRVAVQSVMIRIHPDFQAVLTLHYWEEMGCEEMAKVLNLSLSGVKMRLKRAREAFEKEYEGKKS